MLVKIEALANRVDAARTTVTVAKLRDVTRTARATVDASLEELGESKKVEEMVLTHSLLTAADTDMKIGNLGSAKVNLDKVSRSIRGDNEIRPRLELLYGRYYEARAGEETDHASRRTLLLSARASYERSASVQAMERIAALTRMLSESPVI